MCVFFILLWPTQFSRVCVCVRALRGEPLDDHSSTRKGNAFSWIIQRLRRHQICIKRHSRLEKGDTHVYYIGDYVGGREFEVAMVGGCKGTHTHAHKLGIKVTLARPQGV